MRKRCKILRNTGVVPTAKAAGPSKRGPEDQGDRESARRTLPQAEAEQMDDAPIPLNLERERADKRRASKDVVGDYGPEGHGRGREERSSVQPPYDRRS